MRVFLGNLIKLSFCNHKHQTPQIHRLKRLLQRTKLIQNHAQCPNIWFVGVRLLPTDLWTHIVRGSYMSYGAIVRVFEFFAYSEITDFDCSVWSQEYVGRFYISMKDFPIMNKLEGNHNLHESIKQLLLFIELRLLLLPLYMVRQISLLTVLHNNNKHSVLNKRVVILDYIRMVQLFHQLDF